ncbi:MAG: DNA translocase FtsK 4TM domain-containing protein [Sphingobacteriaceae bacterium]|nr:DNA translocase FtsK 4TM domain-containing protein [Sphingobacteriaceae bacterium]
MSTAKKNKFRETPILETTFVEDTVDEQEIEDFEPEVKKPKEKKNKQKAEKKEKVKETVKDTEPVAEKVSAKVNLKQRLDQILTIYRTEQTQKIIGLVLILFSAYFAVAFVSYFFTHEVDHDKVMAPLSEFFSKEVKVQNWLGKFGALFSHFFIYKGFGVASFIMVPVLALFGVQKLIQRKFINISAFNAKWLFIMVWSSLTLSYIFQDQLNFIGGGYGYYINEQIINVLGGAGLLVMLGFTMLTFLVLVVNLSFKLPKPDLSENEAIESEIAETKPVAENVVDEEAVRLSKEEEERLHTFEVKPATDEPPLNVHEKVELAIIDSQLDKQAREEIKELLLNAEPEVTKDDTKKGEAEFEVKATVEEPVITEEENKAASLVEQFGEYDPTLDLGSYKFPEFDLLNDYGTGQGKVNQEELVANKDRIINTLKNYGIEIEKIMATVGPTVTLYEIVPAAGVRISKIKNLEDDIALSLAALGIRIIAPIPGKGTIGIEVPNQTPEMVPMRNILASEKFNNSNYELPIALGKTISNEIFIADLAKMPHLLMAGATGQGKSVGLNAILVSLLYKKHPAQIKFVLVDPKKVELTLFNKIERHFLAKLPNSEDAIITDNTKVIHTLNSLCIEMDNRYALLQDAQVRNIKEYNTKFINRKLNPENGHKYLPYIVLVVDEFADLIMTAGKEVETPIARLAQLARAIGIHLIIATQRPSVNIITGTIKANFPARIAFRVTSKIDSRTILDSGGAEQLIGRGDMLLSTGNDLIRIQCAFVDTPEVEKITEFIGAQRAYPTAFMLPEYVGPEGEGGAGEVDLSERDKMFDDAAKLVVQFQQGSASFLQRKLKLGYNRAGRIVDQLEAAGFIGPFEGSKAREVLVKDMAQLEEILQKLRNK